MENLKLLFINPASINYDALPIPPLGILYLAAYLRDMGWKNLSVLDNDFHNYNNKRIEEEIKKYDIVLVTGTTSQFKQAMDISRISKRAGKISIFGGPHATALPKESLRMTSFDFLVIGEGEVTIHELLKEIDGKKRYQKVNGIAFPQGEEITITPERQFIQNLDSLPYPARDLIPLKSYGDRELKRFSGQYTHMMTSRGCGSKCTFCSSPLMWKYCRFMSAKRVFKEMKKIYDDYGIKNIHFQDDNFTALKPRLMDLCNLMIDSGIQFEWSCQTRPDRVDEETLIKMKEAGCVQIEYGVESGDPRILKMSKKGYTKNQILRAFKLARKVGITTYGFFLIGLPGETIGSWIKSMRFAKKLRLDNCVWTVLVPFPGTEVFKDKLVRILDPRYTYWLYKQPIIQSGSLGPRSLKTMRWIADKYVNGFQNTGTYKKKIQGRLKS